MTIKKGKEIELKSKGTNYRKYKLVKDFNINDEAIEVYDNETGHKLEVLMSMCKIRDKEFEMEKNWEKIKEKIKHSKISRFPWKAVLGETLTRVIQTHNLNGLTSEETYDKIIDSKKFKELMEQLPIANQDKLKDKLKISCAARFGEKHSSDKLKEDMGK